MSSEDVIELGSSDEETEPAPKRSKPMPDAMVCIPRSLHDVTIKPAKINPIAIAKGFGKEVTVTKINQIPQTVPKNKPILPYNGKPSMQITKTKVSYNPYSNPHKPCFIQTKQSSSSNKVALLKSANQKPVVIKPAPILNKPVKIKNSGPLNLPSSITVKKTVTNRPIVMLNIKSKQNINQSHAMSMSSVEVVDDTPHKSSPQWYLRPEDHIEQSTQEEKNNKEPEKSDMIEITIEDSPVKPIPNKRTHEVGAELAITIDDSPVKAVADKIRSESGSDIEDDNATTKVPQSKKKLEYPKEDDSKKTVEIEIEPIEVRTNLGLKKDNVDAIVNLDDDDKKIETMENVEQKASTAKKVDKIEKEDSSTNEFHPVYQSFINLCFQLENSDDMKKIVEKKIKGYYRQVPKEYTESEEFIDMVSSKILSMKAGPEKMYLYIKDIVDELNLQRKLAKAQPVVEPKNEEPVQLYGEESEYDLKRQRQIRKLEKTIKKLHRAIQKLEEQEVDFDDDDDSVYLLTERYKERMVRVYAKFCQMSNTKMPSEPRIQIDARPGQPLGPAKRLEKWINKKVPIGTPLPFPDFHDVLRCVREANEEDRLNFNEADIMEEARDLFTRCGKKLQRRRQENEWRLAASRIAQEIDPAENNDDLKRKLNENRKIAAQKETEIFNKFADRQNQLKLEGEEIGDKEAEESPVESEDEEANDEDASLENTEKRKDRLKRLLQEKSKKTCEEKENLPSNDDKNDSKTCESNIEEDSSTMIEKKNEDSDKKEGEDTKETVEESKDNEKAIENPTETFSLSDDSNELKSDVDELHLLQKLHSGNEEQSSTADSSDSGSLIAISDSLESTDDTNEGVDMDDDVISIENSSYSENEDDKIDDTQKSNTDSIQFINEDSVPNQLDETTTITDKVTKELECDKIEIAPVLAKTNNDEYNESVENILLASSEEDNCDSQEENTDVSCVNLRDDLISIDETVIGKFNNESDIHEGAQIATVENNKESLLVEVEIGKDAVFTAVDEIKGRTNELVDSNSQEETSQNNGHVLLDVRSIDPVEFMAIDQESDAISEIEISIAQKEISTASAEKS